MQLIPSKCKSLAIGKSGMTSLKQNYQEHVSNLKKKPVLKIYGFYVKNNNHKQNQKR